MTFFETDGDAGLLSPVSASPFVAALTGDRAVLAAILEVEAAWAAVLDEAGLAPAGSAAVVAAAADVQRYDVADLAVRAQGGGNPVIPLLADLREQVEDLDTAGLGAVPRRSHLADQPGRARLGPDGAGRRSHPRTARGAPVGNGRPRRPRRNPRGTRFASPAA